MTKLRPAVDKFQKGRRIMALCWLNEPSELDHHQALAPSTASLILRGLLIAVSGASSAASERAIDLRWQHTAVLARGKSARRTRAVNAKQLNND